MDNLSVHRSNVAKAEMERLGFQCIYNTSYSPQNNPIEYVFALVKHHFKRVKCNAIVNRTNVPTEALIAESFNRVRKQHIVSCVDHCLEVLKV